MQTIIGIEILAAQTLLEQGQVVAIPTETVYGLAANALNPEAVLKIFEAKNRPHFNPLIVQCKSWEAALQYVSSVPSIAQILAEHFCPGALTFLLPKNEMIPDIVTSGSNLVAIRVPSHPLTQKLLQQLAFPIAAPSANQFGYISPTNAQHVFDSLQGKIPYILDGGATKIGLESTIIGFDDQENIIVHRAGGIAIEAIEKIAEKKCIWHNPKSESQKPMSSGQLKSHYAPHTDLIIGDIETLHQQNKGKKLGLISFTESYSQLYFEQKFILSQKGDLHEAAQNLFSALRLIDQECLDLILVEKFPESGLGLAINDRLNRAQAMYKN